jgi:hypothetical protein
MKYALLSFAVLASSYAHAQNCMMYPPGPQRFACASEQHPGLIQKRERCRQQAAEMGLSSGSGKQGIAGLRNGLHAPRAMKQRDMELFVQTKDQV